MSITISKAYKGLNGSIQIPGDKSISHRSVMLSALGSTPVHIKNFLRAADCLSTVECMRLLGANIEFVGEKELIVCGKGIHGLSEPATVMDAGNSGTTLRLLLGLLSAQPFLTTFTGDSSLSRRPMGRVVKPLTQMGARIFGRENSTKLPLTIAPQGQRPEGITYESPVASAQVKSAILLAGMYADNPTTVIEPYVSRNHTEEMLTAFGVKLKREGRAVTVFPVDSEEYQAPDVIEVPGDISSAAFWLVAGSIVDNSRLLLQNVGVNRTRTGIIDILQQMGAKIVLKNERRSGGEAVADIEVTTNKLKGVSFDGDIIPRLVDEIPVIAVAAVFAEGDTVIKGAGELRVKETDRLNAISSEFGKLLPHDRIIEEIDDGLIIHGLGETASTKLVQAVADSRGDHRMAMSLAVLGMAGNGVVIEDEYCVNISYPGFYDTINLLRG